MWVMFGGEGDALRCWLRDCDWWKCGRGGKGVIGGGVLSGGAVHGGGIISRSD